MPPPGHRLAFRVAQFTFRAAFTLLELLAAVAIIALLMVLVAPAFTKMKWGNDVTAAAYTIAGALEQGRNYAMANNTYVWIGFYEEDMTATSPTQTTPPYIGKGRVLIATVFSIDGTKIYEDADPTIQLPANRVKQLGKLIKIEGIHITDIGAPPFPAPSPKLSADSLDGRPDWPYTYAAANINSTYTLKTNFWGHFHARLTRQPGIWASWPCRKDLPSGI